MTKVVVTGGAGYVGSHVMLALKACGYQPHAIDTYTGGGHPNNVLGMPVVNLPYQSRGVDHILRQADVIIHCAAQISAPESVRNPGEYYRSNVGLMTYLLDLAKAKGTPIVFSSSAAVYGPVDETGVVREDHVLQPPNPYGWTKLVGEMMLQQWGLPHVSLRYFNVAGADPELRCGPRGDRGSLFSNILKASKNKTPVTLHMASTNTPDGFPRRDFIHPTDLAMAHVCAVEALLSGKTPNRAFNVGSGQGHSIMSVFKQFKTCDPTLTNIIDEPRPGDPPNVVADPSLIEQVLGWKATLLSSLPSMVGTAWKWDQQINWPGPRGQERTFSGPSSPFLDQFKV
ncbi:UDP-glucose dehydrogenase [Rhodobacter phage RcZahn]|nr:UDP-glucose dehydrogenase [Rhodobacter phage RcZahn]